MAKTQYAKIKFKKNQISYVQDMSFSKGIPEDIMFDIIDDKDSFDLIADGYGYGVDDRPSGEYGNGSISVSKNQLLLNKGNWELIDDEHDWNLAKYANPEIRFGLKYYVTRNIIKCRDLILEDLKEEKKYGLWHEKIKHIIDKRFGDL